MPCRGRAEQTVKNVRRLLATAGDVEWRLVLVIDGDPALFQELAQVDAPIEVIASVKYSRKPSTHRVGYWRSMQAGTEWASNADLLACLANDLLPGQHWLQRAHAAYRELFGDGLGMIGFNDGHWGVEHSPHFLISRSLLDRYGGWPVWYDHNYGDTELVARATQDGLYAKAPWAVLYHDHPYFGGVDDATYAEGRARAERDRQLYEQRRASGWPRV